MEKLAIITKDLTKIFGDIIAVRNLNIEITYGTTYGLLGPNGAGKTTTVRMLNAIISPSNGTALVGGYNILTQANDVKTICGFLPESPGLYSKLT
ncbi:MAG: ATP-binding cassette domain-containing protein, partial [Candidatus Hodarchaeota archaeon]